MKMVKKTHFRFFMGRLFETLGSMLKRDINFQWRPIIGLLIENHPQAVVIYQYTSHESLSNESCKHNSDRTLKGIDRLHKLSKVAWIQIQSVRRLVIIQSFRFVIKRVTDLSRTTKDALGCPKKIKVENVWLHQHFLVQNYTRIPKMSMKIM